MPVSLGLRDEDNERISNMLKQLNALTFVPEGWNNDDVDALLRSVKLSLETLTTTSADELNQYLQRYNLDWPNMELFADVLARLSTKEEYARLRAKAVALYQFIQQESKLFSFEIMGKISKLA